MTKISMRIDFKDTPVSSYIWSQSELSRETLPPLHSVLFGVFRVADRDFRIGAPRHSYVDVAFGSENGYVAGVHRFSVRREGRGGDGDGDGGGIGDGGREERVLIEFSCLGYSPKENTLLKLKAWQTFHLWYAMVLFREGVAEVMKV